MRVAPSLGLNDITEKLLTTQVVDLALATGFLRYHTYRSTKSPAGFPDEVLVRERVIWLELKSAGGKASDHQKHWLRALMAAGQEVYIVRPKDVDALAAILASRPYTSHGETEAAARLRLQTAEEIA